MIPHWTLLLLCSAYALPVVFLLGMLAASLGLISFNDWYILNRAAHRKSSIEALEALFALEDLRGIGQPRPPHRS